MNKAFINQTIYNELIPSLKANFKLNYKINTPDIIDLKSEIIYSNNFYFAQSNNNYFGIKSISPTKSNHISTKISSTNINILFLTIFLKINHIYKAFQNKTCFTIDHNAKFVIDFSKPTEYTFDGLTILFSDNTLSIYSKNIKLFASFYEDELFCSIQKKDNIQPISSFNKKELIKNSNFH